MTLQTHSLGYFRHKIISYYEELINDIDLKTEEILSRKDIKDNQIQEINAKRNDWIKRIEFVREQNILNLETKTNSETLKLFKNDEEKLNYVLFKNGYLIFTEHKAFSEVDPLFIGKLIYKNGYLNKKLIQKYE